jgi:hypothetical protein
MPVRTSRRPLGDLDPALEQAEGRRTERPRLPEPEAGVRPEKDQRAVPLPVRDYERNHITMAWTATSPAARAPTVFLICDKNHIA